MASLLPQCCLIFASESEKEYLSPNSTVDSLLSCAALNSILKAVSYRAEGSTTAPRSTQHSKTLICLGHRETSPFFHRGRDFSSRPLSYAMRLMMLNPGTSMFKIICACPPGPNDDACASRLLEAALEPSAKRDLPPSLTDIKSVVEMSAINEFPVCTRFLPASSCWIGPSF